MKNHHSNTKKTEVELMAVLVFSLHPDVKIVKNIPTWVNMHRVNENYKIQEYKNVPSTEIAGLG